MNKLFFAKLFAKPWVYPVILLFTGVISYVLSSPKLGFYWDDWQAVYLYQTHSSSILRDFFMFDRPFSAWTYEVIFPLINMHPLGWQILTLLFRVVAIWLFTEALMMIWRNKIVFFQWVGVLLLVFPGFTLQSISVAFNQHFLTFLIFSLSIYSMVKAVSAHKWARWGWVILALASGLCELFTMEYFLGLEAIRPFLLWFAIDTSPDSKQNQKFTKWALSYLPYVVMVIAFIGWRLFVYPTQIIPGAELEDPNSPILLLQAVKAPVETLITLGNLVIQDIVFLVTQSWLRPITPLSIRLDSKFFLLAWVAGLISAAVIAFWLNRDKVGDESIQIGNFHIRALLLSLVALVFGGMPVWITNRQILEGKWSDRFSLAPSIGAVLFLVLSIYWVVRTNRQRSALLLLILAASISYQMQLTHKFGLDWDLQKDFYWQLAWRAPALKPQTAIFSASVPSTYSSHYSAGFALDTLYGREPLSSELDVWYFRPNDVGYKFFKLEPGYAIAHEFRNLHFTGNTSNAISIMYKPASGCLLVLDEVYRGNPAIDENHDLIIPLTNQSQILNQSDDLPDPIIFGQEPTHDWCFYFEKADLARQAGDWSQIDQLMSEAKSLGFSPKSGTELLPALEAAYQQGLWSEVLAFGQQIISMNSANDKFLCSQLNRLSRDAEKSIPGEYQNGLSQIVNCSEVLVGD